LNPALPYTAVAWIKPDATETDGTGVVMGTVKNVSPTGGWRILWDKANTRINVTYHDGVALRTVNGISTSVPAGTYVHVVVTFVANGGNTDITIYLNGSLSSGPTTATGQPAVGNA